MNNSFFILKKIVKAYLTNNKLENIEMNIADIYQLSSLLNVPCVIGYTLKINGINNSFFEKSMFKSIKYDLLYSKYRKIIKETFDKNNIKYIYLKGETLARYYKEPFLRFSSDIDLIIHNTDYDKALDIMKNDLFYSIKQSSLNELTLVNKEGVTVDFHSKFELNNSVVEDLFKECFKDNELNNEYKYVYLLDHEAKHFVTGQLDLRFFIDLYYLRDIVDKRKIDEMLKQIDLLIFDKALNSYLDYLLEIKQPNEYDLKIEDFIISYAQDQGAKNRVSNHHNRIKYFINHAFPSYAVMKGIFPILNDIPILLPYYYLVRIFKMLFSERRKYVINEVKNSVVDSNNLVIDLGLLRYNK